jgi:hypothetical protein
MSEVQRENGPGAPSAGSGEGKSNNGQSSHTVRSVSPATRAAMGVPGACLEYRSGAGRVLLATVGYKAKDTQHAYTVKLAVGPISGRRFKHYPNLARCIEECEAELSRWSPGPWNREAWTPAARAAGSGAVTS